jgi:hypothetical protein
MKTYVADFIPRFKKFSKELDNMTLLINQHWVMVDEITSTKTVYIFQRNNRLLLSQDGKVEKAEWEMIDPSNVLVTVGEESFMFKHGFLDDNVLALKLDGKGEYALFFNENKADIELNGLGSILGFLSDKYDQLEAAEEAENREATQSENITAAGWLAVFTLLIAFLLLMGKP